MVHHLVHRLVDLSACQMENWKDSHLGSLKALSWIDWTDMPTAVKLESCWECQKALHLADQ